jgi:thiol-disulfide isomerase/thioredoxin
MNPPRNDLRWSIWESVPCVWNECPAGCMIGAAAKNERNVEKVIQVRSYQMKKIAIVLCVGLLIGLPAALTHAQLAVAKQGEQLPTLALNYLGKQPELTGKPLLVEFWATWCPPCRKSIPHLNEIYAKYKGQGLQIVGITDENEAIVKKFQKQVPMDYNVAINTPQSIYEQFGIQAIPTAFLVNKTGKIVWTGHPMELSETEIQSVLN